MERLLIIGFGNVLRHDEGIGWYVAQLLAARLPEAHVITIHQLTAEMTARLANAEFAAFFDAFEAGEPGDIRCAVLIPNAQTPDTEVQSTITPTALLTLTQQRYGYCPPAILLSVAGLSFDHGSTLSPLLHQMLTDVVDEAAELILRQMALVAEVAPVMPYIAVD